MNDTTQQQVFEIIAKQAKIDVATIKPESTLKDLGIASLEAIELIFDIEEHFNINFPDQQGAELRHRYGAEPGRRGTEGAGRKSRCRRRGAE